MCYDRENNMIFLETDGLSLHLIHIYLCNSPIKNKFKNVMAIN